MPRPPAVPFPLAVVGALCNSVFLIAVCFNLTLESIHRFRELDALAESLGGNGVMVLAVASVGLLINVIGVFLFACLGEHGHSHIGGGHSHAPGSGNENHAHSTGLPGQLPPPLGVGGQGHSHGNSSEAVCTVDHSLEVESDNAEGSSVPCEEKCGNWFRNLPICSIGLNALGVLLHIVGDLLGSIGVCISGAVITWGADAFGPYRVVVDPLITLVIVLIILVSAVPLTWKCVLILLQETPPSMKVSASRLQVLVQVLVP